MFGIRSAIGQFFEKLKQQIVRRWSEDRDPSSLNCCRYSETPTYSLQDKTNAYQWLQKNKTVIKKKMSRDVTLHFVPSSRSSNTIDIIDVENYLAAYNEEVWPDLDSFLQSENSLYPIQYREFELSNCRCPFFLKHYKCKHVLGLAYLKKDIEIPLQAKQIEVGAKRKRGAPVKNRAALIRQ